jgi:putative endopeptidase
MTLSSGIPINELDPGIRPQDDLFRHVNGRWLARTEIPADRARYGSFLILREEAEKAVREIVAEAASGPEGSEERKFGDLYASFMDADRAERLGSRPISQTLAAAQAVSSIPELLETLGRFERLGVGGLYRLFVSTDPGDPQRYLVFFQQAAISLPDESYYREERFASVRDAFVRHVQRMFELAGLPDAGQAASRVFELETAVAAHHWDRVASRDIEKTYNLVSWTDALSAGPDLRGWLAALDPPAGAFDEVVLRPPSFSAGLPAAHRRARSGVAGLAVLAGHPRRRRVPVRGVRRGGLRFLRPHPERHPPAAGALEARCLAGRGGDRRGGRAGLRRPALSAPG